MNVLTIRLPDDTADQLRNLAKSRGISVNKMVEDLSVRAIAAWDTENHFRVMASRGDISQAIAILDRLDNEGYHDSRI